MTDIVEKVTESETTPPSDVSFELVKSLNDRIELLEDEVQKQRADISCKANQIFNLHKLLKESTAAATNGRSTLRDVTSELSDLTNQLSGVENEKSVLLNQNKFYKKELQKAESALERLRESIDEKKVNASVGSQKSEELQQQITRWKVKVRALELENEKLSKDLALYKESKVHFNDLHVDLLADRDLLRLEIEKLLTLKTEAETKLSLGQQAFDISKSELESKLLSSERLISEFRDQLITLSLKITDLSAQLDEEKQRSADFEKRWHDAVSSSDEEITRLTEAHEQLQANAEEKDLRIGALEGQLLAQKLESETLLSDKDKELEALRTELHSTKETMRIRDQMKGGGESGFSPAAKETVELIKNAPSLTEIYSAHIQVKYELAVKQNELDVCRKTLNNLREMFTKNASALRKQKEQHEQLVMDQELSLSQLNLLKEERKKNIADKDNCLQELQFTRNELEKFQRQCRTLSDQLQHILLVQEQGPAATADSNPSLYANIKELQVKNRELTSKISTMEVEKETALQAAENKKFKELKESLARAERTNSDLSWQLRMNGTLVAELNDQIKYLKKAQEANKPQKSSNQLAIAAELNTKIAALETQLGFVNAQLASCRKELQANEQLAQSKESAAMTTCNMYRERLEKVTSLLTQKGQDVVHAKKVEANLTNALRDSEIRLKAITERLEFVDRKMQDLSQREDQHLDAIRNLTCEKYTLSLEVKDVTQMNSLLQSQLDELAARTDLNIDLTAAVNDLQTVLGEKHNTFVQVMNNKVADLQDERNNMSRQLDEAKVAQQKAEHELQLVVSAKDQELANVKRELDQSQTVLEPLKKANEDLEHKLSELTEEYVQLKKDVVQQELTKTNHDFLLKENGVLKAELLQRNRISDFWRARWEESLSKRLTEFGSDENKEQLLSAVQTIFNECHNRMEETSERIYYLAQQLLDRDLCCDALQNNFTAADDEIRSLTNQLESRTLENASLKAELNRLQSSQKVKRESPDFEDATPPKRIRLDVDFNESELRAQIEEQKAVIENLHNELEIAKQTSEREKRDLEESLNAFVNKEQHVWAQLNDMHSELQSKVADLNPADLAVMQSKLLQSLRSELVNVSWVLAFQALFQTNDSRLRLQSENNMLKNENRQGVATQLTLRTEVNKLRKEVAIKDNQVTQQKQQFVAQHNQLKAQYDDLCVQLEAATSQGLSAQKDKEIETLKQQVAQSSKQVANLTEEDTKNKDQLSKLRTLAKQYRDQRDLLQKEINALKTAGKPAPQAQGPRRIEAPKPEPAKPAQAAGRKAEQNAFVVSQKLRDQCQTLTDENKVLTEKLKQSELGVQRLQKQVSLLETQLKENQSKLAKLESEGAQHTKTLEELNTTIETERMRNNVIQKTLEKTRLEKDEQLRELNQLRQFKRQVDIQRAMEMEEPVDEPVIPHN